MQLSYTVYRIIFASFLLLLFTNANYFALLLIQLLKNNNYVLFKYYEKKKLMKIHQVLNSPNYYGVKVVKI